MFVRALSVVVLNFLFAGAAMAEASRGAVDRGIETIFKPIADVANAVVFAAIDVGGTSLPIVVVWLIAGALFFTFYMRFINLRGFRQSLRLIRGLYDNPDDPGEVTHFQALTAALSGTVGLGNIAGVALAITIGGPGATFWMILAGFFGMTTKFVECTLGVKYRVIDSEGRVSGGPMYYLSRGLANKGYAGFGRFLGAFSAIMVIGGTLGSGAFFQVNQATQQILEVAVPLTGGANSFLAGSGWIIGLVFAVVTGVVVIGGIKKITHVTEILVPFMALLYLGTALIIIMVNIDAVPAAFASIVSGAFSPEGVTGGFLGVLIQGVRRASFSNEAGLGSAAIAHAAAKTNEPIAEGLVALMEPFFDTVIVCTATALVIITTGFYHDATVNDGIRLTSAAFASTFSWFPYLLSVAAVLFAFSTSITWYYYGQRSFFYLFGQSTAIEHSYRLAFFIFIIAGSASQLSSVVALADAMILGMAFPNIAGLFILAPEVKTMLKSYMERLQSGEIRPYKEAVV